ncbi:Uncharacterised protein [Mycobacteroides abscessus subsp. abscessus]|nr:Uncharacterised protein [Mycobacteroides abscessus subsp. abscessus]
MKGLGLFQDSFCRLFGMAACFGSCRRFFITGIGIPAKLDNIFRELDVL